MGSAVVSSPDLPPDGQAREVMTRAHNRSGGEPLIVLPQ
jgi:hypothetical protein